jgi:ubiquinone/menaquinone biosynthesis C-methylase UbiE
MNKEFSVDPDVATAAMRAQWDQAARGWRDSGAVIRPWLQQATQAMLGMAGVKPGAHVLDVAAGAGDQTLDIAERVGPDGYVLATDLSPEILQFAAQQAAAAGHRNVETRVSDGQNLQVEDTRFDAVVCRLGLMIFGDPLQGLREMARVLKPRWRRLHHGVRGAPGQSLCDDANVDSARARRPAAARSVSALRAAQSRQARPDR